MTIGQIDKFGDHSGCADIDSQTENQSRLGFTSGEFRAKFSLNVNAVFEDFGFVKSRLRRYRYSKVVMNGVLAGQDFLSGGFENGETLSAGAFSAADGIQNYSCLPGGFEQSGAFVDDDFAAVRLKGYGKMLHLIRIRHNGFRSVKFSGKYRLTGDFMPYFPAGMSFFAAHFATTSRFTHTILRKNVKKFFATLLKVDSI
jgi:hypothetical protein